jgi:hypothetical protein
MKSESTTQEITLSKASNIRLQNLVSILKSCNSGVRNIYKSQTTNKSLSKFLPKPNVLILGPSGVGMYCKCINSK